ncbi:hypothetical protein [Actinomadura sp. RB99]|nr:hypothetical protein [Actinomadura sp. RB99]
MGVRPGGGELLLAVPDRFGDRLVLVAPAVADSDGGEPEEPAHAA